MALRCLLSRAPLRRFAGSRARQPSLRLLHYERQGSGPPIVCLAGALGTGATDFGPQLTGLSDRFTVIAPDPEGYGKSRPPERSFDNFVDEDAVRAAGLMKELGHESYGVLGWSDGGNSAAALAGMFPENVSRLVMWGGNAYVTQEDINMYQATADLSTWSKRMRAPLEAVYGDSLQSIWTAWNESMVAYLEERGGNLMEHHLAAISCPTLILHGEKDPMVPSVHPRNLRDKIADARLCVFPAGKHNIHLKYAETFNDIVGSFLLCPETPLRGFTDEVHEEAA